MKRIITAILAVVFMLALVPVATYAADLAPSSLTVVMEYNNAPLSGISVGICLVAEAKDNNGDVTFNTVAAFAGSNADWTSLTTADRNVALAQRLSSYASANNIAMTVRATDSTGKATFTGLTAGMYLVTQQNAANSAYEIAPYLVMVPASNDPTKDTWTYNVVSYPKTEPVMKNTSTTSVSVYKIWVGTDTPPASVQVQLYQNGLPYGAVVTLNSGNYWRYTWSNLNPAYTWTVDEPNVPAGYTKTVSGNAANGFIITNTRNGYTVPNTPEGPTTSSPSSSSSSSSKGYTVPFTGGGSAGDMPMWSMYTIAGSVGLLALLFILISKRLARDLSRK